MILPPKDAKKIPIGKVVPSPFETRKNPQVDDDFLETLKPGLIESIVVWHDEQRDVYPLVSGQRRTLGGRKLGWEFIDALVFVQPLNEIQASAAGLVANLQRAALDSVDEAEGVDRLARLMNSTNKEVAQAIGKSPPTVTRLRRRAIAPDWLKEMMRGGLSCSAADALLECADESLMRELAAQVGPKRMSKDDVQRAVRGDKPKRSRTESVVVGRPGKPAFVMRGVGKNLPMQQAMEVVRDLLADLIKAAKSHALLGDAVRAWRVGEAGA